MLKRNSVLLVLLVLFMMTANPVFSKTISGKVLELMKE